MRVHLKFPVACTYVHKGWSHLRLWLGIRKLWIQFPALPEAFCETSGKSLRVCLCGAKQHHAETCCRHAEAYHAPETCHAALAPEPDAQATLKTMEV